MLAVLLCSFALTRAQFGAILNWINPQEQQQQHRHQYEEFSSRSDNEQVQGVHQILCFFPKILKYSVLSLFSLDVSVCVHTHQAGRIPALRQNWESSEKSQNFKEKTQYLMNTL